MATGSVIANWYQPGRPNFGAPTVTAPATRPVSAAPASAPVASSASGLQLLDPNYLSAITQYLDPAAMEAAIRADSEVAARHAAADRGFSIDDPFGARLQGEIQAPALQAMRQQLLGQIVPFAQLQQQQQQFDQQLQDNAASRSFQREQQQWAREDHKDEMAFREEQQRQQQAAWRQLNSAPTRSAPAAPGAPVGVPGGYDGQSSTGQVIGGPAQGSTWDTRLGSDRNLWAAPKAPSYSASNYETAAQAAERQAGNPRSSTYTGKAPDYSGASNNGGYQVPGVSPAGNPTSNTLKFVQQQASQWRKF